MQNTSLLSWLKHIDFMIIDTIVLFLSFWFAYSLVFNTPGFWNVINWNRYLLFALALNLVLIVVTRPFSGILRRPYYMEVVKSFQLTVTNALIAGSVMYLFKVGELYSRGTSIYMYSLYFVFSALLNALWKKLLLSKIVVVKTTAQVPLFVIGDAATIHETIQNVIAGDLTPYEVAGIHLVEKGAHSVQPDASTLGAPLIGQDYCRYILEHNIREVLVAAPPTRVEEGVLQTLQANAVNVNIVVESAIGFIPEDQYFSNVGVYRALGVGSFSFTSGQVFYLGVKRIADIVCGLIGLVVLVPVTLFVKLAYLSIGDRHSIFYRQARVGQNGKPIYIWKFRSMVSNAGEVLEELLKDEKYREEWDANQKFEEDPRITRVGDILRKTSIDELPQLINVLKGDMSLVGPRPLVQGELEKHGGLKLYERVKPGITGWWACNGRSNIEYRERLELEYYYVRHLSLHVDILCVLRTVFAVFKRDGAV